jgi:hypothetical protein
MVIIGCSDMMVERADPALQKAAVNRDAVAVAATDIDPDRKSTRLNSSHRL